MFGQASLDRKLYRRQTIHSPCKLFDGKLLDLQLPVDFVFASREEP